MFQVLGLETIYYLYYYSCTITIMTRRPADLVINDRKFVDNTRFMT